MGKPRYGKSVDLWSAGVIAYVILRGRLPFEGRNKKTIVHKITSVDPPIAGDPSWRRFSPESKALINRLLTKLPRKRPTVDQALKDKWFENVQDVIKKANEAREKAPPQKDSSSTPSGNKTALKRVARSLANLDPTQDVVIE